MAQRHKLQPGRMSPLLCRSPQYVTGPGTFGTTLWTSADDQMSLWLLTYINRRLQVHGFTSETLIRGFIDIGALSQAVSLSSSKVCNTTYMWRWLF